MAITSERGQMVFRRLERALLDLAANQHADSVHRFRTSTRRVQTLIEELIPERDRSQEKLLKLLERVRRRAGKVRDVDTQLSALRSLKTPQEPRRKTQLIQNLIELRAKHENKLRKSLTKSVIREIRKRLKRVSKLRLRAVYDPLAVARQMLAQVPRHGGLLTEDVLHQHRVMAKRARHAAEFAPQSAEATHFIAQLKRLQDAIGNWHDWFVLTRTAIVRLGDIHASSLVAELRSVTRGKFRHALTMLSESPAILIAGQTDPPAPEHSLSAGKKGPTTARRADSAA